MSDIPVCQPGDRLNKAIAEFSLLLQEKPEKSRQQLLAEVALRFDLSPRECLFLERHFSRG
jgi:hypothetical protein